MLRWCGCESLPLPPLAPALVAEEEGETKLGSASKRSAMKRLVGMVEVGRKKGRRGAAKERGRCLLCRREGRQEASCGVLACLKRLETWWRRRELNVPVALRIVNAVEEVQMERRSPDDGDDAMLQHKCCPAASHTSISTYLHHKHHQALVLHSILASSSIQIHNRYRVSSKASPLPRRKHLFFSLPTLHPSCGPRSVAAWAAPPEYHALRPPFPPPRPIVPLPWLCLLLTACLLPEALVPRPALPWAEAMPQ